MSEKCNCGGNHTPLSAETRALGDQTSESLQKAVEEGKTVEITAQEAIHLLEYSQVLSMTLLAVANAAPPGIGKAILDTLTSQDENLARVIAICARFSGNEKEIAASLAMDQEVGKSKSIEGMLKSFSKQIEEEGGMEN